MQLDIFDFFLNKFVFPTNFLGQWNLPKFEDDQTIFVTLHQKKSFLEGILIKVIDN